MNSIGWRTVEWMQNVNCTMVCIHVDEPSNVHRHTVSKLDWANKSNPTYYATSSHHRRRRSSSTCLDRLLPLPGRRIRLRAGTERGANIYHWVVITRQKVCPVQSRASTWDRVWHVLTSLFERSPRKQDTFANRCATAWICLRVYLLFMDWYFYDCQW